MNARCDHCGRVLTISNPPTGSALCKRCASRAQRNREGASLRARALSFLVCDFLASGVVVLSIAFVVAYTLGITSGGEGYATGISSECNWGSLRAGGGGGCTRHPSGGSTGRIFADSVAMPSAGDTVTSPAFAVASVTLLTLYLWRANATGSSAGKRRLEMKIVGPEGAKPGGARGLLRTLAYPLDAVSLVPGPHSLWSRHAWMHDVISGCRVVPNRPPTVRSLSEDINRASRMDDLIERARKPEKPQDGNGGAETPEDGR